MIRSPRRRHTRLRKRRPARFLALSLVLALGTAAHAVSPAPEEYDVKAAFIYNFAKYVEWPRVRGLPPNRVFVIGVLGEDPFGAAIDRALQGRIIQKRAVVLQRYERIEDAVHCDILFVASSERTDIERILQVLGRRPVLTIGDTDSFATRGGMINLITADKRVRFEINVRAMELTGLKPDSQLLRLARIVGENR